jgi:excinuclease ABC subunit A
VIPFLERRAAETDSDWAREKYEGYMRDVPCPACAGTRLKPEILGVTLAHPTRGEMNIAQVAALSIREAAAYFPGLDLSERESMIAHRVL